jgi:hypothetical protein
MWRALPLLLILPACDALFAPPVEDAPTRPRRDDDECERDRDCDGGERCDDGECVAIGEGEGEGEGEGNRRRRHHPPVATRAAPRS